MDDRYLTANDGHVGVLYTFVIRANGAAHTSIPVGYFH